MAAKPDKKTEEKKDAKEAPAPLTAEEQLAKLHKRAKLSQMLIIGSFVISTAMGAGALGWAAATASTVKNIEPEKADAITDKIDGLEQRLSTLFQKQDEFQYKVESTYTAIEEIRAMREERDFGAIQKILLEQRQDYNDMLAILNTGVISLANMLRGSRDWTDAYTKRLQKAIEVNQQRIEAINQLPSSAKKDKKALDNIAAENRASGTTTMPEAKIRDAKKEADKQ